MPKHHQMVWTSAQTRQPLVVLTDEKDVTIHYGNYNLQQATEFLHALQEALVCVAVTNNEPPNGKAKPATAAQ